MARRRIRRAASYARASYRRARSTRAGGSFFPGVIAGALVPAGRQMLGPQLGPAVVLGATGHFMRDPALMTLAGVSIGQQLSSGLNLGNLLGGGGSGGGGGGGTFL